MFNVQVGEVWMNEKWKVKSEKWKVKNEKWKMKNWLDDVKIRLLWRKEMRFYSNIQYSIIDVQCSSGRSMNEWKMKNEKLIRWCGD